jgi:microcompartment protein CcmL/EutN
MKRYPAIAVVEFRDIAAGLYTADAMVKKAPITVLRSGTISHGRYLIFIGGSTASAQESYQEGLFTGGDSVIDHVFLPDVHPAVLDAVLGKRGTGPWTGALAVLETRTVACHIRAAELALKGTPVDLVELRLTDDGLAGKGVSVYHGALHDIQAAMEISVKTLEAAGVEVLHRIITAPHESIAESVEQGTHFSTNKIVELDGEV